MRLLLAEDEEMISDVIVTLLESAGYEIDAVYDGEMALSRLESEFYDGAILDIMMPKASGIMVLKEIRKKGNSLPVLMLTAKSEIEDKLSGFDNGANDYLTKPFDSRELLARIRSMIKVQGRKEEAEIRVGNICLNCTSMTMYSPTNSMCLSTIEFQVMELLMKHSGCSICKQQIEEKIGSREEILDETAVWMYVSFLRKKLAALHADVKISDSDKDSYLLEGMLS